MKLTRLEIKGFKSFADKVIIHFDDGITSIVGPNGCGKSNVVDAIRWVLGEQSTRALRSEKMENIIFNGTNTRKQAQLAEVSLSFDNTENILPTDFSQVTITRKLYRSGESEYRLNDVQCRLKDITDLFLDTGIGSDTYAIIELKMVEEIISNKDHSRRNLFEEASGISKYKIRKRQTLNRLKDTEGDLSRVDDLLLEIKKNLKSLENQANKAERYHKLKEQYKTWSLNLSSLRIAETKQALENIEEQILKEETNRVSISASIVKNEASLQQDKELLLSQEQNVAVQQKRLNIQIAEIQSFETDIKIKKEQFTNLNERSNQLLKEIEIDKEQVLQTNSKIKRLQEQKLEATILLTELESKLTAQSNHLESFKNEQVLKKQELDEAVKLKDASQKLFYELEKKITVLTIQADSFKNELQHTKEARAKMEAEHATFNDRFLDISSKLETLTITKSEEEEFETNLNKQVKDINLVIEETKERFQKDLRLLDAKNNEYDLTKSMIDNLEGYPEAVQFLKKSKQWNNSFPLLSEILSCQENYRITIEDYLEPYLNYYIVNTSQEAYQAIELLNDAKKGKAGFFILDAIPSTQNNKPTNNNLTAAIDIIDVDDKYVPLCQHLLKDVFITKSNSISTINNENYVLLEENGKYLRNRYSLFGGSIGLFGGKTIGGKRNLEKLVQEIDELNSSKNKFELELINHTQSRDNLINLTRAPYIEELKNQINRLSNECSMLNSKQEQYEDFIKSNNEKIVNLNSALSAVENELQTLVPKLSAHQKEQKQVDEKLEKKQHEYNLASQELTDKSADFNLANINFHKQKNVVSGLEKDLEYKENEVITISDQLNKKAVELSQIQHNLAGIDFKANHSDEDKSVLYEEKLALEKGLDELEKVYFQTRAGIGELEQQIQTLRKNKEIADTILNELKDQKNNFNLEFNRIKERLSVEFSFDITDLHDLPSEHESEEVLVKKIEKIKNQLDNFGPINSMALDAFEEMKTRYEFIIDERNDLLDAKKALLKTINEIDFNAKEKFMESFTQVRDNFQNVFRSLFNEEDTCDLVLTDPENPLESDIDIIAHPKGKRPLSINQLSGGEKTLTSTALLFSLYLLKPAPFCIFDEIDAPLDDTNIDKFNSIIRDFSANSQFIIVSHNKRTIASTDIIYGITMVESGISKVVAVDLRESLDSIIDVNQTV